MWWKGQNLNKQIADKSGTKWNFLVWHDHINGIYTQRIYFWDSKKEQTGIVELEDPHTLHITKIKDLLKKIALKAEYREKYLAPLKFPIEKNY